MDKIFWIEAGRVAGRCGPSLKPLDLAELCAAGFRSVLSLDAVESARLGKRAIDLELKLIHLPNSIPPQPMEILIFEKRLPEAVRFLQERAGAENGAVLVHCHAGNDRTGGVLTGYLQRTRGLSAREALAEVRKANPHAISAQGYEEMILRILDRWER